MVSQYRYDGGRNQGAIERFDMEYTLSEIRNKNK